VPLSLGARAERFQVEAADPEVRVEEEESGPGDGDDVLDLRAEEGEAWLLRDGVGRVESEV